MPPQAHSSVSNGTAPWLLLRGVQSMKGFHEPGLLRWRGLRSSEHGRFRNKLLASCISLVIEDRAILLAASRNRPLEASLLPRTLPHGPDRPSVVVGVEIELGAIKRHFARFAPCFWRVGVWPTDAFQKIYFLASRIGRGGGPNRAMSLCSPHLNLLSYPVYTDTSC